MILFLISYNDNVILCIVPKRNVPIIKPIHNDFACKHFKCTFYEDGHEICIFASWELTSHVYWLSNNLYLSIMWDLWYVYSFIPYASKGFPFMYRSWKYVINITFYTMWTSMSWTDEPLCLRGEPPWNTYIY